MESLNFKILIKVTVFCLGDCPAQSEKTVDNVTGFIFITETFFLTTKNTKKFTRNTKLANFVKNLVYFVVK